MAQLGHPRHDRVLSEEWNVTLERARQEKAGCRDVYSRGHPLQLRLPWQRTALLSECLSYACGLCGTICMVDWAGRRHGMSSSGLSPAPVGFVSMILLQPRSEWLRERASADTLCPLGAPPPQGPSHQRPRTLPGLQHRPGA